MTPAWIEQAVQALKEAGISAVRGYSAEKIPHLSQPMATVSLQQMDADGVKLGVQLYGPVELGGTACENLAPEVAEILCQLGAACTIGACGFEGKAGVFCVPITATFKDQETPPDQTEQNAVPAVWIDGVQARYVVDVRTEYGVDAVRVTDSNTGVASYYPKEPRCRVTIEEQLPRSEPALETVATTFSLEIVRPGSRETYEKCCWEKITTKMQDGGVQRTRVALAGAVPTIS